ncbi:MAG: hypothetical protein DMF73_16855 [Acidobacteria bacterium]|nr:MAG: hypothetical protein DMF73_16855 [Acidobacteriota bacterium]
MLIYHPAFDSYHAIFRSLTLLDELPSGQYEIERIRILDFYLLFPVALKHVIFPQRAVQYRRRVLRKVNRYEQIEDPQRIFGRLEPYQMAAFRFMAATELIDGEAFASGKIQRTSLALPNQLADDLSKFKSTNSDLIHLLTGEFRQISLYGPAGLKYRTHLFEHRYDAAPTVPVS